MAGKKGMKWPVARVLRYRRDTNVRKTIALADLKAYVAKYGRAPHSGSKLGARIKNLWDCAPSTLLYMLNEVE